MPKKMSIENMSEKCEEVSALLKSIAHPQRLMITCHLAQGEMTVSELQEVCDISQSQLSQFLARLARENVLVSRREGQFSYYSIKDQRIVTLLTNMYGIFCE